MTPDGKTSWNQFQSFLQGTLQVKKAVTAAGQPAMQG